MAYARLRDYLGLPKRLPKVYDMPQQLAIIEEDVLDHFNIDVVEMGRGFATEESDWHEWVLPDGTECLIPKWVNPVKVGDNWVLKGPDGETEIAIQKKGMVYFDQTYFPFMDDTAEKIDRMEALMDYNMWAGVPAPPGPVSWDEEGMKFLAEGAKRFREQTDRAIVGLFGAPIFEGGQQMVRMDNYLMLLAAEPDLTHRFLDKLVSIYLKRLEMYLKAVGPHIDLILFSDDYGMQTGPQISVEMFREFFTLDNQVFLLNC